MSTIGSPVVSGPIAPPAAMQLATINSSQQITKQITAAPVSDFLQSASPAANISSKPGSESKKKSGGILSNGVANSLARSNAGVMSGLANLAAGQGSLNLGITTPLGSISGTIPNPLGLMRNNPLSQALSAPIPLAVNAAKTLAASVLSARPNARRQENAENASEQTAEPSQISDAAASTESETVSSNSEPDAQNASFQSIAPQIFSDESFDAEIIEPLQAIISDLLSLRPILAPMIEPQNHCCMPQVKTLIAS